VRIAHQIIKLIWSVYLIFSGSLILIMVRGADCFTITHYLLPITYYLLPKSVKFLVLFKIAVYPVYLIFSGSLILIMVRGAHPTRKNFSRSYGFLEKLMIKS